MQYCHKRDSELLRDVFFFSFDIMRDIWLKKKKPIFLPAIMENLKFVVQQQVEQGSANLFSEGPANKYFMF